ncbi:peroxisome proliferator-activated receptor gamma coactivator-related protein 1 [Bombina bombina]|uniref:peroxisome proliferator-activated receptor gamma coactivator-related protein 1 n=1 Tax=Bombina bombina TaxID=8345 RepID=UPI00235AAEE4|nr:peroxisome proliferator-activated receptor gamma coactivator-related protein 1 [Bombina bombina]
MAARWGAGDETLTIGGMELFTAGSPFQCRALDEDDTCGNLSDLSLTSLDSGEILGTFQGYVDHSIISIINAPESQADMKCNFDEENELSLLTALTEILDNADDENLSPFDSIPDSELLVSPRERDSSSLQKFLSLSRSSGEREVLSMDDQRRSSCGKIDGRSPGHNWEAFTENIRSTPKRNSRHRNIRGSLLHRVIKEPNHERSDGEEEEEARRPKMKLETFGQDFSIDPIKKVEETKREEFLKQKTPYIINTENVAAIDLVKYMHTYCLPSVTVCLEPDDCELEEDDDDDLSNTVFLEIVSEEGECVKLPLLMDTEFAIENASSLDSIDEFVSETNSPLPDHEFIGPSISSEERIQETLSKETTDEEPQLAEQNETKNKHMLKNENSGKPMLEPMQQTQVLENELKDDLALKNECLKKMVDTSNLTLNENRLKDHQNLEQLENVSLKNENEHSCSKDASMEIEIKKPKKKGKGRKSSKRKAKTNHKCNEDKLQDVVDKRTPQSVNQDLQSRSNNPLLKESDFFVKQIDQVKKDSQMELRVSKLVRAKGRTRGNLENPNSAEKKLPNENTKKPQQVEKESSKPSLENVSVVNSSTNVEINSSEKLKSSATIEDETSQSNTNPASEEMSNQEDASNIPSDVNLTNSFDIEEKLLKEGDNGVCDVIQQKEPKPKSLSLSEYRRRIQQRKPNERENETVSGNKWPSIPEPPTELAEIPCLIIPGKVNTTLKPNKAVALLEEKPCTLKDAEKQLPLPNISCNLTEMPLPPVTTHEVQQPQQHVDMQCSTFSLDHNLIPIPPQSNVPPPFYQQAWHGFPPNPCYSTLPPMPTIPHFSNGVPNIIPVEPTPVMPWPVPPFPPPPIIGQVPPPSIPSWGPGLPPPPPFWASSTVQQQFHDSGVPLQNSGGVCSAVSEGVFNTTGTHVLPDLQTHQNPYVAPTISQNTLPHSNLSNKTLVQDVNHAICSVKDTTKIDKPKLSKESIPQEKSPHKKSDNISVKLVPQVCNGIKKPDQVLPVKTDFKIAADAKKPNVPDIKSANEVVLKVMEMLKRIQRQGLQVKTQPTLESAGSTSSTLLSNQKSPDFQNLESSPNEKRLSCAEKTVTASAVVVKPLVSSSDLETPQSAEIPVMPSEVLKPVAPDKLPATQVPKKEDDHSTYSVLPQDTLTTKGSQQIPLLEPGAKCNLKVLTCENGIEASDLTTLLEEFEKSEAKDEQHIQTPVLKLAVGNSRSEKPSEKKILDRLAAPELVNTAGLTPPATPPHQLWKPVTAVNQIANSKPPNAKAQEKLHPSPMKTAKLIEPKPLPQNKLRNRNSVATTNTVVPPVHVGSGDHDYCILSASNPEKRPITPQPVVEKSSITSSHCEEGSRWNVKHHQNILIKPILTISKSNEEKVCQKLPASESLNVTNQSSNCDAVKSRPLCKTIQKDQLDHRTNDDLENLDKRQPDTVLMSPDSSPCRSDAGDARTGVQKENAPVSRRALRCYRKHKSSPSPQKSSWIGRGIRSCRSCSSGSGSESTSSSSRSRSRSPPTKRRRTYRPQSPRSRSSSVSSYDSSRSRSSSSSSSYSSQSCSSPSSSRSRSRSRSPYRRRYRSRSRRCESRESYNKRKIFHKERAIEERRVVYIGKISSQMTRSELRQRFSVFGEIEECTIHFREQGDNYGFVTYHCTREAFAAIENGHKLRLPDELPFDLCFGGRRQFCKRNYADLDSNRDEFDPAPVRSKFETLDFDTLLKQAQKSHRR